MPDPIFADPRLAQLYDPLDPDRTDLDLYVAMVEELGARSVVDVGCGTGTLACLLANRGLDVVASTRHRRHSTSRARSRAQISCGGSTATPRSSRRSSRTSRR